MALEFRGGHPVDSIPANRAAEYDRELAALTQLFPNSEPTMRQALNNFVDERISICGWTPRAEFASSWIPGQDWSTGQGNGAYQPIYETMVRLYIDPDLAHRRAGFFFGLLLMDVMIDRGDSWEFWREPHQSEDDVEGLHYRPKL